MIKLASYLPKYYDNSRYFKAICAAGDAEFDRLRARVQQVDDNAVVDKADEDGLKAFERDFCLSATSDTAEVRKGRIKAKMRGSQPTTRPNLISALRIFDPAADIEQHPELYSFKVYLEAPGILAEVMALVEDIKPAHLATGYEITTDNPVELYFGFATMIKQTKSMPYVEYATYDDIKGNTYEQLRSRTYRQILYREELTDE